MMALGRAARSVPCILAALTQFILAESSPSTWPVVHLHTASIDTRTHLQWHEVQRRGLQESRGLVTLDDRWGVLRNADQFLISMQGPLKEETLQRVKGVLNDHGGWLSSYIPDSSVLGIGPSTSAEALRNVPGVLWVGEYKPEYKLAEDWGPLLEAAAAGKLHATLQQHHEQLRTANGSFRGTTAPDLAPGGGYNVVIHVHFPTVRNATAARLSGSGAVPAFAPAEAAAADWAAEAEWRYGGGVSLRPEGRTVLAVSTQPQLLQEVLGWLAEQPAVHWLAPRAALQLHNWQGSAIVQSGNAAPDAPVALAQDRGSHPIWAAGLTGAGQIVGAGDSGIDRNNCFFNDPNVDWKGGLSTDRGSGVVTFSSEVHRKIRLYRQQADDVDNNGHGTHTVASLLGSPFDISNTKNLDYRGLAPDAKVAFIDLASRTSGGIYTPQDLSEAYYPFSYDVGARVHSDSWGSGTVAQDYDFMASEVDMFTWEHQDFTAVFAAGNEGFTASQRGSGGLTTVTSPATSKNCICAGATNTAFQQAASTASSQYTVHRMSISQLADGGSQVVDKYRVMQASFGASIRSLFGQQIALSVAHPADGCAALDNQADVAGTVVLVLRGTCFFAVKALNAQTAGAKAILVYDDQINDYFVPASDGSLTGITIPSGAIPRRTGQLLVSSSLAGGKLTVSFLEAPPLANAFDSLAEFSSKGPTKDGRVKPDLLAPGTLQSAYTDGENTCSLRYMEGTSMATPLVAASAALVRQYFLTGFYPSGAPVPANQFAPSGALVKAVLLGGAAGMDGFESDTGLPLAPPPSFRQGFGRVHLGRSLPLQGSGPGWNLQVVDMANLSTGQAHQYCVRGLGGPLSVTLVWHDYPAAVSAKKALVNDLDLTIRAAGLNGVPLLGNGGGIGSGDSFAPDRTNNVEQVSVSYLPPGEVAIEVKAFQTFVTHGPQAYALVVLGKFSGILASPGNPANGGTAPPGTCHIIVTTITGGPQGLTNQRSVTFAFTTATGNPAGVKFECALTPGAKAGNASAAYKACTSPTTFDDLADGAYTFSVRAQGEDSADSRSFVKDTSPPKLSFNASLPESGTASPTAYLSWAADDSAPVSYRCQLSATAANSGALQPPVRALLPVGPLPTPALTLGSWADCAPPLQLYWLLPGSWRFEVQGQDAAGNAAVQNLLAEWIVEMEAGEQYARITAGPFGPTANRTAQFALLALEGGGAQETTAVPNASFDCRLSGWSEQSSYKGSTVWSPCDGSTAFKNLRDGDYTFWARIAGRADAPEAAMAASNFTVDTSAPVLKISSAPPAISTASTVSLEFNADKAGANFSCLLTISGNATGGNAQPTPCASPARWDSLSDGRYSFSLAAADRLGNKAAPVQAAFLIDTTPPVIADVAYPFATRNTSLTVTFNASDSESGVNSTQCRMRPQKLTFSSDSAQLKGPRYEWGACASPASFSNLTEGKWGLSLRAQDNAGQTRTTSEAEVYVTRTPPNATVVGGPRTGAASPPKVAFSFASQVAGGGAGAPIAYSVCLLQLVDNSQMAALQQAGGGEPSGTGNVNVQLKSVSSLAAESWSNCSSPAEFKGLRSGNYTFQVKSVDAAGNIGAASQPYAFTVDDTLPVPGESGAGWFTGWHRIAVIAGAAAAGVILLVLLLCACCMRRRRLHRLRSEGPVGAALYPQSHHDPALAAALRASLAEQQRASAAAANEARTRAALVESLEEERMRRALERSLLEQRSPSRREGAQQPLPREPSDADMRRALQESLEEEQLRRVLADSERAAATPTAPLWDR